MQTLAPRAPARTLTPHDLAHLTRLLAEEGTAHAGKEDIRRALDESRLAPAGAVAPGLVTLDAQVFLVAGPQEQFCRITLVLPPDADPARGRVSVLSPLGSALLGRSTGETATWRSFGRVHAARIVAVLAPLPAKGPDEATR
ncbi:GreA/GreB family elongation factor [Ramlibacter sp. USB13]|uniref:GreA/GreB family elongation factor n=1 Tax=Ramlibacter cellulosilyticus TaxID=2764187 RepID=A0A923MTB6_9BURK|nr:GreA/GreB family elongation factor [Ramlibacter cellulosilyticus]MBC5784591.1 GreA/GreB family elongation factor [Ramlibacter cellulosilyticus]